MSTLVKPEEPRAYSYIRFSTPQQAHGDSLDRQKDKAAKWASEHGLVLDTDLKMTDAGVSAHRGKNARTGALARFVEAVEKEYVPEGSYLLVENIDRLTRDDMPEATTLFMRIINAGVTVVTLTNGLVFSKESLRQNPVEMIYIVVELMRANQESARKSQMVGAAKARKKGRLIAGELEGKPYTRSTPAWIRWNEETKEHELIPERAAIVRDIFERADVGHGIDRIAKDFNQWGIDTWGRKGQRKADHWRGSYIRKILLSTAPIGTFTPHTTTHDEVTRARRDQPMTPVENYFPAAVPEELYWRVHRRLETTAARGRNAGREPKSIVAGLIHCASCGHSVTRVSKGTYVYLVCSRGNMRADGCKYWAVPYVTVVEALRTGAKTLIADAPRGKSTAALDKEIDKLQANADHLENHTFQLADLAARENSTAARRRLTAAETDLRGLHRTLRDLRAKRDTLTTASVRDRLKVAQDMLLGKGKSVSETNRALRQAIRRIMLDPEQGRLWVQWHHSEEVQDVVCVSKHTSWKEGVITIPPIMTEMASA